MYIKQNHFINEIDTLLYKNRNDYTYDHTIIYLQNLVDYNEVELNKKFKSSIIQSVGLRIIIEGISLFKYTIRVVFGDFRTLNAKIFLLKEFSIYDTKTFFNNIKNVFEETKMNNYYYNDIKILMNEYNENYFKKM